MLYMPRFIIMCECVKIFVMLGSSTIVLSDYQDNTKKSVFPQAMMRVVSNKAPENGLRGFFRVKNHPLPLWSYYCIHPDPEKITSYLNLTIHPLFLNSEILCTVVQFFRIFALRLKTTGLIHCNRKLYNQAL